MMGARPRRLRRRILYRSKANGIGKVATQAYSYFWFLRLREVDFVFWEAG
jgi:hypothetical protein